jgi:flagellar motor switch protein FliN
MAQDQPNPDQDPAPASEPAPNAIPDPIGEGPDAEAAIQAAQAAVTNLQQSVAGKTGEAAAAASRAAVQAAINQAKTGRAPLPPEAPAPFEPQAFDVPTQPQKAAGIDLLSDVNLNVKIELGRTRMLVEDVLKLTEGAVVELDKLAGDPVDVYVNDRHVARGEVLVLNDNFCVRINEIVQGGGESVGKR